MAQRPAVDLVVEKLGHAMMGMQIARRISSVYVLAAFASLLAGALGYPAVSAVLMLTAYSSLYVTRTDRDPRLLLTVHAYLTGLWVHMVWMEAPRIPADPYAVSIIGGISAVMVLCSEYSGELESYYLVRSRFLLQLLSRTTPVLLTALAGLVAQAASGLSIVLVVLASAFSAIRVLLLFGIAHRARVPI